MKAKLIKELHAIGIYRDLTTKKKLESMKIADLLNLMDLVKEEQARGAVFKRVQEEYIFVKPATKQEKLANKGKKKR